MNHDHSIKRDIVVIGPLNVDLIIKGTAPVDIGQIHHWSGHSQVNIHVAGAAGYVSQNLAHLGMKVGVFSTIADDSFGNSIKKVLSDSGVDIIRLQIESGTETSMAIYILLFGSKKRPLTYTMPTHSPWPARFSLEDIDYLLCTRHLHCAGYLHYPQMWDNQMAWLFQEAHKRGITTSLDPQFPLQAVDIPWKDPLVELLQETDLLLLDENEAYQITKLDDLQKAAYCLCESGVKTVVIKRGAKGSLVQSGTSEFSLPALSIPEEEIIEEVGAGDAYDAGYLHGMLSGFTTEMSAAFATATAASSLRGSGGSDALASVEQIMRDLQRIKFCD